MGRKSLISNSLFNVMNKLLGVLFPFISVAYASRILLANGIGKVSSAQNTAQYFIIIAALGIPTYGIREVAKYYAFPQRKNKLFSELFYLNAISTAVCASGYFLMVSFSDFFYQEKVLYYVIGLSIILNVFNIEWFYQGIEEYKYIAIRSLIVKIGMLIVLFISVKKPSDYINYAFVQVLGMAGNYILNILQLNKYDVRLEIKGISLRQHIKPILILLCTNIAIELYSLVDITMLSVFCSDEVVGYYTNATKLVKIIITVVAAIGGTLLPRLSSYYIQGNVEKCGELVSKTANVLFFVFAPCGVGLILLADKIMPMAFGDSFIPATVTLRIAALLIYALGFSNLFGTQVLMTFDKERQLMVCTLIGAFTNVILNSVLIPIYAQNGAAIASVISELLVTVFTIFFARKCIYIKIYLKDLVSSIVSTVIMVALIGIVKKFVLDGGAYTSWAYVIILVITGGVSFIASSILLKNSIIIEAVSILKKTFLKQRGKYGKK